MRREGGGGGWREGGREGGGGRGREGSEGEEGGGREGEACFIAVFHRVCFRCSFN